jgi:hypothetical protein
LPTIETVPADGLSSVGLGDRRALGTMNNSWLSRIHVNQGHDWPRETNVPGTTDACLPLLLLPLRDFIPLIGACGLCHNPVSPLLYTRTRRATTGTAWVALNSSRSVDISPLLVDASTPLVICSWTLSNGALERYFRRSCKTEQVTRRNQNGLSTDHQTTDALLSSRRLSASSLGAPPDGLCL